MIGRSGQRDQRTGGTTDLSSQPCSSC